MTTTHDNREMPGSAWEKLEKLNPKLGVDWDESKDEVWGAMEQRMQLEQPKDRIRVLMPVTMRWAVAAILVLLLGSGAFMRLYTQTQLVPAGEHRLVELPDGSKVQLNAESELAFHPYWWAFSRQVAMEGEAYFEVKKGSRFEVESDKGITAVLGTSFNIYARDESYRVACLTGKVQVSTADNNQLVILLPGERAELEPAGLKKMENEGTESIAWTQNKFVFTAEKISAVFREIERQYNITIELDEGIDFSYSGNFEKSADVRLVLGYVCRPFNLKFTEKKAGLFRIEGLKKTN